MIRISPQTRLSQPGLLSFSPRNGSLATGLISLNRGDWLCFPEMETCGDALSHGATGLTILASSQSARSSKSARSA